MNADIPALMSAANWWERAGYAAAGLVLVGIVVESFELFRHIRSGQFREKRVEFIGLLIVILGLAFEILAQVQSNNRTGLVIAALDAEARGAEAKIADANKTAQKAADDAAKLGVSVGSLHDFVTEQEGRNSAAIGELKRSATDLNRARDDAIAAAEGTKKILTDMSALLEKQRSLQQQMASAMAPRSISAGQAQTLVSEISKYPNTTAAIYVVGDTPEIANTAQIISQLLGQASWKPDTWNWSGVGAVSGILVTVKEGSDARTSNAATALVVALRRAGIDARLLKWPGEWDHFGGMLNGPPNPAAATMRVIVGAKP